MLYKELMNRFRGRVFLREGNVFYKIEGVTSHPRRIIIREGQGSVSAESIKEALSFLKEEQHPFQLQDGTQFEIDDVVAGEQITVYLKRSPNSSYYKINR